MITAKKNTIVFVRSFEGYPYPFTRATLKGCIWVADMGGGHWEYVIKPLQSGHGYERGVIDTARRIIPARAIRWIQGGCMFSPRPFCIDNGLPIIKDL